MWPRELNLILCDNLWAGVWWGGGGMVVLGSGREFQEAGDIYRPITDSC